MRRLLIRGANKARTGKFKSKNLSGGIPGEVKHSSSQRKINRTDSVSSGERKRNSLNFLLISLLVSREGNRDRTFEFFTPTHVVVGVKNL